MPKCKLNDKQAQELSILYQKHDIKLEILCQKFGISDDTIVREMKRLGVPMRITTGYCNHQNSNWKGGYSLHYAKNLAVRSHGSNICFVCGYGKSTDVHHIDENKRNNNSQNLVLLCPNHHRELHLGIISGEDLRKFLMKV